MPAKPSYFHRFADALEALQGLDSEWVDRKTVEELLGISKTVAWRVLRQCGAEDGPGNTLICRKDRLVAAWKQILATGDCDREVRRRDRVSAYLDRLAEMGRSKRTRVASDEGALALVNSKFHSLPPGVELTARKLTVEYASPEEFLARIGSVIYALQNDYESVRAFIESGNH